MGAGGGRHAQPYNDYIQRGAAAGREQRDSRTRNIRRQAEAAEERGRQGTEATATTKPNGARKRTPSLDERDVTGERAGCVTYILGIGGGIRRDKNARPDPCERPRTV